MFRRYFYGGEENEAIESANRQNTSAAKFEPPIQYDTKDAPIRKAGFIPLRLSMPQRKSQRLIRAITLASCYTDKVDIDFDKPVKRELAIVKEVLGAIHGLIVSLDLRQGAELMKDKDFSAFKDEIVGAIEVSRRYKIMNPDLLRTDYVKFLYLLQDATFSEGVKDSLGFNIARPILTVQSTLEQLKCPELLQDPRLPLCITPVPKFKKMDSLNQALRFKDRLVAAVCKEYAQKCQCTADDIEVCVRSLNDANNFNDDNSDSAGDLLRIFQELFNPADQEKKNKDAAVAASNNKANNITTNDLNSGGTNLSIVEGQEGSRLSHSHAMQFHYVVQSLTLWRLITRDMFRLWKLAEDDMLNPTNPYEYRETGQGKHRVQPAPNLFNAIKDILAEAKSQVGQWIGSERIHMGDNQVPNSYFFLEKYAQISRIIVPILRTIKYIERRYDGEDVFVSGPNGRSVPVDPEQAKTRVDIRAFRRYIDTVYGAPKNAQLAILRDFFRHGFDGSGGDNMDDAGSCIDGRLTSAWNWCNQISNKQYYPIFLMAGFQSFDGDLTL